MFYDAVANTHGLKWDPFKALVAPRPIGWISTLSKTGVVNLAPYSFFNAVSTDPHFVMFSSGGRKDSQRNAEETGEFVCSLATYDLRDAMNRTSQHVGPEVDEMALAGLTPAPFEDRGAAAGGGIARSPSSAAIGAPSTCPALTAAPARMPSCWVKWSACISTIR